MRLREPNSKTIRSLLCDERLELTYPEVGLSRDLPPVRPDSLSARYDFDHHDFELGTGAGVFLAASRALLEWQHLALPWLRFHGIDQPVEEGATVASLVRVLGFWFLNPCRIIWTDFESPEARGFGYGTLRGHAECGEERFRVRIDPASERVHYEITAFSRPALPAARLGYPLARRIQRRFAATSAQVLQDAIG